MTRPLARHTPAAKKRRATPGYSDRGYGIPKADSIKAAADALRRTRTLKEFVLNDGSKDLDLPCTVCGLALSNPNHGENGAPVANGYHGNRVEHIRRNGAAFIRAKHYWCSWGALLTGIGTADNLADAARNVERLSGGWIAVNSLKGTRNAR